MIPGQPRGLDVVNWHATLTYMKHVVCYRCRVFTTSICLRSRRRITGHCEASCCKGGRQGRTTDGQFRMRLLLAACSCCGKCVATVMCGIEKSGSELCMCTCRLPAWPQAVNINVCGPTVRRCLLSGWGIMGMTK
jgi:hypothetical protein